MDVDAVKRILDHVTGFHSEEQVDDDLATTANNSIDKVSKAASSLRSCTTSWSEGCHAPKQIELDRQKQRMVIEARQAAEKKAQEEADTTEVKRKARGTKRAKKGTKRHRPDSSDADDQESDEEADEELAEAAEGVSDEDEDMVDLAEGEKGEEQVRTELAVPLRISFAVAHVWHRSPTPTCSFLIRSHSLT